MFAFYRATEKSSKQRDSGQPLASPMLSRASAAFGRDLGHVRVSTGRAPGGAGTLGAAFGNRIVLDQSLRSEPPLVQQFVLAHELAHVAQQSPANTEQVSDSKASEASAFQAHEQAHLEANANAAALALLSGRRSSSLVSAPLSLSRCARPTGTMITAAHFNFRQLVPIRPGDGDPAGWQAASIRARMSKDVGGVSYGTVFCLFEVGVPLRNHLGPVPTPIAQSAAAAAANSAAYTVLSDGSPASAAHCILFRRLMEEELSVVIPGARVSAPISPSLPVTDFP